MKHFKTLMTYSSPSLTAVVIQPPASDPALGSVRPKEPMPFLKGLLKGKLSSVLLSHQSSKHCRHKEKLLQKKQYQRKHLPWKLLLLKAHIHITKSLTAIFFRIRQTDKAQLTGFMELFHRKFTLFISFKNIRK